LSCRECVDANLTNTLGPRLGVQQLPNYLRLAWNWNFSTGLVTGIKEETEPVRVELRFLDLTNPSFPVDFLETALPNFLIYYLPQVNFLVVRELHRCFSSSFFQLQARLVINKRFVTAF
jgi:hypothetical protein